VREKVHQLDDGQLVGEAFQVRIQIEWLPAARVATRHPAGERKAPADQVIAESATPRGGGGSPGVGVSGRQLIEVVEIFAGNRLSRNWHPVLCSRRTAGPVGGK
jgi:hypothetical protein